MNFAAGQLDMWWPASRAVPRCAPAVVRRVESRAWRAATSDYPPRAAGRAATSATGFETLLRHAPPNVEVRLHRAPVESVRESATAGRSRRPAAPRLRRGADRVGHDDVRYGLAAGWTHAAPLVPASSRSTAGSRATRVPPGATVAIRGFALTFIDAALALTEGRGGSFEPLDHPYRLRYVPGPGRRPR